MSADGSYARIANDSEAPMVNAQAWFLRERATPRLF
jgi:hypothetical protein